MKRKGVEMKTHLENCTDAFATRCGRPADGKEFDNEHPTCLSCKIKVIPTLGGHTRAYAVPKLTHWELEAVLKAIAETDLSNDAGWRARDSMALERAHAKLINAEWDVYIGRKEEA